MPLRLRGGGDKRGSREGENKLEPLKHNSVKKEHKIEEEKGEKINVSNGDGHNVPLAESYTKRSHGWSTLEGGGLRGGMMEENNEKADPKFRYDKV